MLRLGGGSGGVERVGLRLGGEIFISGIEVAKEDMNISLNM